MIAIARMFAVFLLSGVTICYAETTPMQGSVDARVREVVFDENDVRHPEYYKSL